MTFQLTIKDTRRHKKSISLSPNSKAKMSNKSMIKRITLAGLVLPILCFIQPSYSADTVMPKVNAASSNVTFEASPSEASKNRLMSKLGQLAFFSANFTQKIISEDGDLLQEGAGNLSISKPNLVNWHTTSPDETLIISDGSTLWFFDPFIEQVNAYSLEKSIDNTPILLLTSDDKSLWEKYHVVEEGLRYVILPKDENSQIKRLSITFTRKSISEIDQAGKTSQILGFSFQDATGQISQVMLSDFNTKDKPKSSAFIFNLPEGVKLEDNR